MPILCRFILVSILIFLPVDLFARIIVSAPHGADVKSFQKVETSIENSTGLDVKTLVKKAELPDAEERSVPAESETALQEAKNAFRSLEFEKAREYLIEAETTCLSRGYFKSCKKLLFDVYLLTGVIDLSLKKSEEASTAFRTAHNFSPTEVVDPSDFPPKIISAFNRMVSEEKKVPLRKVIVKTIPDGALLDLNGKKFVSGDAVPADGKVVLEARMVGYKNKLLVADATGESSEPLNVKLTLEPLSEEHAWGDAERVLMGGLLSLGDPGVEELFEKLKINGVIFLEGNASDEIWRARFAKPGAVEVRTLPDIKNGAKASEEFIAAFRVAVGLSKEEAATPLPPEPSIIVGAGESTDDEEEDSAVRFTKDDEGGASNETSKIFKSPWFWVSVGVVVAVVGVVIVGTQTGK